MSKRIINFPPGASAGDKYSLWTFTGSLWELDPEQATLSVKWEDLLDKPEPIDQLGIDNEVNSGSYVANQGKREPEKFWSEKKL